MDQSTVEPEQEKQPRIPGWLKRFFAIAVSIGILWYYFHDQEWQKLIEACSHANLWIAVAAVFIPQILFWFIDVLLTERHMTWFHGPFSFWKFFWVKGAAYILMFTNAALGVGGLALYIQRRSGITWSRLAGIFLYRTGLMLWGMGFIGIPATLAIHYYGIELSKTFIYIWWFFLLGPGLIFFISTWYFWFGGHDPIGLGKFIVRNRESEFWTAFNQATRKQWLLTWAMILPPVYLVVIGFYFLNRAFGINVPFFEFMVLGPLAMAIMDLPIAVGGFGTTTVAWMLFFGEYGTEQDILALTIFLPFARAAVRAIIGLVSLRPALKEIATLSLRAPETEPAAVAVETEESL